MAGLTRRDLFKSSAAATAASVVPPAQAAPRRAKVHKPAAPASSVRDRLLLDFGWRFRLGHACDQDKDFGFGLNQHTFAKAGDVAAAAALDFDDSADNCRHRHLRL